MKKNVIYVACGSFIIIAVIGLLLFIFSGENLTEKKDFDIDGRWRVVTYINNGEVNLIENEFMIFSDNHADAYRDGKEQPYASSNFTINSSQQMLLPEISKKYIIDIRSENHIRLYESADTYMYLIRYPNEDMCDEKIDISNILGKWDVVYRDSAENYTNEYLVFEDKKMYDYQGNSESPVATLEYFWDGNQIVIDSINKRMVLHIISDIEIIFVETDTGFLWELRK